MDAGENGDAGKPEQDSEEPGAGRALALPEEEGEDRHEDRQRRVSDRGHAGVDASLAPGDQREGQSGVDDAEDDGGFRDRAHLLPGGTGAELVDDESEER